MFQQVNEIISSLPLNGAQNFLSDIWIPVAKFEYSQKVPLKNLSLMFDFPTPKSPTKINFIFNYGLTWEEISFAIDFKIYKLMSY